jgi:hypothetical protein
MSNALNELAMVDREARKQGAQLIQQFGAGIITNDDFDNDFPRSRTDPALGEIHDRLWLSWDDRFTHRLTDKYRLNQEGQALFQRCVLFLHSNLEYEWRRFRPAGIKLIFFRMLHLQKAEVLEQQAVERLREFGELDVWPFRRREDYEREKSAN